ncbi:hypothetical protein ID866_8943 [Astraeus odoratus]|nr:hypothetical protein ID866_8943 [Astraeus odoratus]
MSFLSLESLLSLIRPYPSYPHGWTRVTRTITCKIGPSILGLW